MINWESVFYNEVETNIQVTKCGRVRRITTEWYNRETKEVDYSYFSRSPEGYIKIGIKIKGIGSKSVYIHQLIASAFLEYKFNGNKLVVHHKLNPLCNCLHNLEIITNRQNNSIERTLKTGLPVGVNIKKQYNKYQANIRIENKKVFLGYFDKPEDAADAYQNKLKEIT